MKAIIIFIFIPIISYSQVFFTSEDTLRGSNTKARAWWDVLEYRLDITPDISNKKIKGTNLIFF